jgi:glutaredoxin
MRGEPGESRSDARRGPATVVVYGKPDCTLCDKATAILEHLRREFNFRIAHADITSDPGLFARYRERIPVVVLDERELAWGIVTTPGLRSVLARALRT